MLKPYIVRSASVSVITIHFSYFAVFTTLSNFSRHATRPAGSTSEGPQGPSTSRSGVRAQPAPPGVYPGTPAPSLNASKYARIFSAIQLIRPGRGYRAG